MNDETENVPGETGEPVTQATEATTVPADDGTVTEEDNEISETVADIPTEEYVLEDGTEATEETVSITLEDLHAVGSGIMHADLVGSFLICGTLVGIFLWRKAHGD